MKTIVYTSIATLALGVSIPAQAANESIAVDSFARDLDGLTAMNFNSIDEANQSKRRGNSRGRARNINRARRGEHITRGGFNNRRGGFRGSYVRPFIGFRLPTFWINPAYYIPNYRIYNLRAPTNGYVWSRYYDDAVLRDQQGFVAQTVNNVQWQDGNSAFAGNAQSQVPVEGQVYSWNEGGNVGGTPQNIQAGNAPPNLRRSTTQTFTAQPGVPFEATITQPAQPIQTQQISNQNIQTGSVPPNLRRSTTQTFTTQPGVPFETTITQPAQPIQTQQIPNQNFNSGYEQCLRSNGVTGAALGALIGGIAGNRIGGQNNRTSGALIGGGVGALSGLAIEKAADKCKGLRGQTAPQGQFQQGQFQQGQFQQAQGQFRESENGEYAQCLRKRGITGTVLGALLGGVAGNRIAGRDNRTAGALIGGGIGAITGRSIEKATRKCAKRRINRGHSQQQIRYYQPPVQYYWASPGYYYPQTTTTVTVTPGAAAEEEVVYEEQSQSKRLVKPSKRLKKPIR